MTRPSYDPLRPPAPRFPRHRFEAAGLDEAAVGALAETYEGMGYAERIAFAHEVTRVPNEELARRYAGGTDAGASPALLTPEQIAEQMHLQDLRSAAKAADLPAGGSKVEIAARLVDAGRTGDLPIVTQEQVAADAAAQQPADTPPPEQPAEPAQPPQETPETPAPAADSTAAPAEAPAPAQAPAEAPAPDTAPAAEPPAAPPPPPEAPSAPEAPAPPAPAPEAPAAPAEPAAAATAPAEPAPVDAVTPAPAETPAAPADGTTPTEGTS